MTQPDSSRGATSAAKLSRLRAALRLRTDDPQAPAQQLQVAAPQPTSYPLAGLERPATPNQTGVWFLSQDQGHGGTYSVARQLRLQGPLDEPALALSVRDLVARHSALRSTLYFAETTLMQRIGGEAAVTRMYQRLDLKAELADQPSSEQRLSAAVERSGEWYQQPFDLENGPLFRVLLCRLTDDDHLLVLNAHHAITDGWSQSLLLEELALCYNARRAGKEPCFSGAAPQFATVTAADSNAPAESVLAATLAEWQQKLEGIPDCIALPVDKPRPPRMSGAGGRCAVNLSADDFLRVRELASSRRSTPFGVLMSAFVLLIFKLTGHRKIAVGVPLANRDNPDIERTVGYVANTLPLVADVAPHTTGHELIDAVTASLFDTLRQPDMPFGRLVQQLNPKRDPAYHPLFQLAFSLQPDRGATASFDDLEARLVPRAIVSSRFDLTLMLDLGPDQTSFFIDYAADLFHAETIDRWALDMARALDFLRDCGGHPLAEFALSPASAPVFREEKQADTDSVSSLFTAIARRFSAKTALVMAGERGQTLSYAELDTCSTELARALVAHGIRSGNRIAVCLPRSFNAVIAILGVLKSGAVYVPLDPDAPAARLQGLLRDSDARLMITGLEQPCEWLNAGVALWRLKDDHSLVTPAGATNRLAETLPPGAGREAPACLLYTSGSTGKPKGVVLPHRAILRLVHQAEYAALNPDLVMLHMAPLEFDAATFELWGPLLNGGTCVVYPHRLPDPIELQRTIAEQGVTTAWITSSLFNALIDEMPQSLAGLREILTGGEALSVPHIRRALKALPTVALSNGYGPTENGTFTTVYRIPPDFSSDQSQVPIGRPIAGGAVHVLDEHQTPVQAGIEGELWVSGQGVALGYANDPDEAAFRRLPGIAPGLLYRTGDRVRQLSDGNLVFVGRRDDQFKINGFRVELGEIEHALRSLPDVRNAAVALKQRTRGNQLIAFVVLNSGQDIGEAARGRALRTALAEVLPVHMLPQAFVFLAQLPTTPNGKVDRQRLLDDPTSESGATASTLLAIWRDILDLPGLQPDDNFFESGGHSILAVRLMARVETSFGKRLPLGSLFEAPSVNGQLALLTETATAPRKAMPPAESNPRWSALVPVSSTGSLNPLFLVHSIGGQVHGFSHFANAFPDDLPVYGIQSRGYEPGQLPQHDMIDMAASYVAEIRRKQPQGPYFLGGLSFGGLVAFEMAAQLERAGERVAFLLIGDSLFSRGAHIHPVNRLLARLPIPPLRAVPAMIRSLRARNQNSVSVETETLLADPLFAAQSKLVHAAHQRALQNYEPPRIGADITLVVADTYPGSRAALMRITGGADWGWNRLTSGRVHHHKLAGTHHTMFYGAHATQFPELIRNIWSGLPDVVIARAGRVDL